MGARACPSPQSTVQSPLSSRGSGALCECRIVVLKAGKKENLGEMLKSYIKKPVPRNIYPATINPKPRVADLQSLKNRSKFKISEIVVPLQPSEELVSDSGSRSRGRARGTSGVGRGQRGQHLPQLDDREEMCNVY